MNFYINSGKLKKMKIKWNLHPSTRPSKGILRESLFDSIDVRDYVFIEAFAGSGSVGIEALSRGASCAIFYEKNPLAYSVLQENLKVALKREPLLKYEAYNADFFTQTLNISSHFILYLDPPFPIREGMSDVYERCFSYVENLGANLADLIVFEHFSRYNMPLIIGAFTKQKTRMFGKSALSYYIAKD